MADLEEDEAAGLPTRLPVAVSLPSLSDMNVRIGEAIEALPPGTQGAVFLLGDRAEDGTITGKVAIVERIGENWSIDVEGHVAKKSGQGWDQNKWNAGGSVLVRGTW